MPWKVDWRVLVDGQDMTSAMRPFLISVTISDKDGTASDTCSLEFDDAYGQLRLPQDGAKVQVYLEGVLKFDGTVDKVNFNLSRGGGRTLSVGAKGFDANGKVKQPQSHHLDDASLDDFLSKVADKAGVSIKVDPAFAGINRPYWSADAESFLHLGQKLARELGGTFKIRGHQAVFAKKGGADLMGVMGVVGQNVISCSLSPITMRRRFKKSIVRYFDRPSASFKAVEVETDDDRAEIEAETRTAAADEGQARDIAEGRKTDSKQEGGGGSVELDLTVEAQPEAMFVLQGARPGIDGAYRISGVTHKADRGGGSTTSLELKQPGEGAGADERA